MEFQFPAQNPYVGPRPFTAKEQELFFGREREAGNLVSAVIAHRTLLLYARSGAGKTSLINASLIPRLEREGFEILPLAHVRGVIPSIIRPEEISNMYIFNTLMSWNTPLGWRDEADPRRLARMSLLDFLGEREHLTDEVGLPAPRVVIFDQLEELFTSHPERWRDREGFFAQVCAALEADSLLRMVFVVREEYLARLDPYAPLLPDKLRTHFRLEPLDREATLAAVTEPLRGTGCSFGPGVAEALVEDLLRIRTETDTGQVIETSGEFVDLVQLQVVCQSLWQALPPEVSVVTTANLMAFGDVNQTLSRFYERVVHAAAQTAGLEEGELRAWFEQTLITPAGTRGLVYRGPEQTGGISNAVVDELEHTHLIRGEWRAGARWYELAHDRFIMPIQQSNLAWLAAQRRVGPIPWPPGHELAAPRDQAATIRRLRWLVIALAVITAIASVAAILAWIGPT
ncbi:MAG: hypothetical protein KJ077_19680 [Anaerolineae bacterium]|nr:hypothetical protein [Anaerolineae bacterium]